MIKCPNCGYISVIPRKTLNSKGPDHLKNFHCPKCTSYQKHTEIDHYDEYVFRRKNGLVSGIKVYRDKRRVEVKVKTSNSHFRRWDELENSLVTRSIIHNSDYNLIETFILNYLDEGKFAEEINDNYRSEISLTEDVIMKFNISRSIYDRFIFKCEDNNLVDTRVLHHILEYIFNNDIDLEIYNEGDGNLC